MAPASFILAKIPNRPQAVARQRQSQAFGAAAARISATTSKAA